MKAGEAGPLARLRKRSAKANSYRDPRSRSRPRGPASTASSSTASKPGYPAGENRAGGSRQWVLRQELSVQSS